MSSSSRTARPRGAPNVGRHSALSVVRVVGVLALLVVLFYPGLFSALTTMGGNALSSWLVTGVEEAVTPAPGAAPSSPPLPESAHL